MLLDEDAGPLTEDQRTYLTTIQSSNQRAIDLIRSLLNVSRLNHGTFCIVPTDVSLENLIEEVLSSSLSDSNTKNITISKKYDEVPRTIVSDKNMCLVVIKNLITNAISFSKQEGVITISSSYLAKNTLLGGKKLIKDSIVVTVTDTGIGIPGIDQEKIFSKMFKASNSKDSETAGSGLGLYIAKTALTLLGGHLWFTSSLGEGSTFYAAFPEEAVTKKEGTATLD